MMERRKFLQQALACAAPALMPASALAMLDDSFIEEEEWEFDWQGYRRANAEAEGFWITLIQLALKSDSAEISNKELGDQLDCYFESVITSLDNKGSFCLLSKTVQMNKPMIEGIVRATSTRRGPEAMVYCLDLLRRISCLGYYLEGVSSDEKEVTLPLQLGRLQRMFPNVHQSLAECARHHDASVLDSALITWSQGPEEQEQRQLAMPEMREGLALLTLTRNPS
jgi:hypothetical protein